MAKFDLFIPYLLQVEGGYQAISSDSGNYNSLGQLVGTNYGISAKVYESWLNRVVTVSDMQKLSKSTAIRIYKDLYWNKLKANNINSQSVANIIVDHGVNAGLNSSVKITQKILNTKFNFNLKIDGIIGNSTLTAINSVNAQKLFEEIKLERKNFYQSIGGVFLNGWLNRLNQFTFNDTKKKVV